MGPFHLLNRLLTSRIAVGLVLFALLALLIWFGGPKLGIDGTEPLASRTNRLVAIAVLAVAFLALEAFRRWRLQRLNRRILSSLGDAGGAPDFDGRLGRVREGYLVLCEALRGHGRARARNRRHLYEQPWYLLLGQNGSGRSTALAGSGLDFVLDDAHARLSADRVPGRGGECGWWVTDDAVFVVAPGDFVTELGPAQAAEWDDLLECLKSGRRRHPLNGIILTMPAGFLLHEATALETAGQMRRRVQEAMAHLRVTLPIYLLVTKCDRIAGFSQYFSGLDAEERARPLGVTLPLPAPRPAFGRTRDRDLFHSGRAPGAAALGAFAERYRRFVASLAAWTPTRLAAEREPHHRRTIFGFPQQMQALGEPLEMVVRRIFGPSRFRREALLRGVFFSSACQRGPITDLVMQVHRQAWELAVPTPPAHEPERAASFFLKGLFQDVIVRERGLMGRDPAARRGSALATGAAFALTITAAFAVGASLWLGGVDAARQAEAMSRALTAHEIDRATAPGNDFTRMALAVAPLRPAPAPADGPAGAAAEGARWSRAFRHEANRLGTLAGRTMLRIPTGLSDRMSAAYDAAARALVRPAVVNALGDEVAALASADTRSVDTLRKHLAIYLGLADTARFDVDALREWAGRHALGRYPLDPVARARVVAVVGDAFDGIDTAQPIDATTVEAARARLRIPAGGEIHAAMVARHSRETPAVTVSDAMDERMAGVFAPAEAGVPAPRVPGYFSEPGFYEQFVPNAPRSIRAYRRNDWLAGEDAAALSDEQLFAEVGAVYARDYIAVWNDFLDGLAMRRVRTSAQALRLMESLLSSRSPLDALIGMVAEHTTLPVVRGSGEKAPGSAANAGADAGASGGVLDAASAEAREAVRARYATWPGDAVRRAFAPYRALHDGRTGELPGLGEVRSRIGDLYSVMAAVDGEPDPEAAAFGEILRWIERPRESEVSALRGVATAQPKPLGRMLVDLSDQSTAILMRSAREHLARQWRNTVHDECRRAIEGRYPVDRGADIAIAPADFETFFRAGGAIDEFFEGYVRSFLDTTGASWAERGVHGHRFGFRDRALEMFRHAGAIRDAFGLDGASLDDAGFTIEPVYLASDALWVAVETRHETFSYRHEPPRRFRMRLAEEMVSISITDRTGTAHVARANATWAWFRMFDRFRLEPAGVPDQYDFTVGVGGLEAGFRISADSIVNPLAAHIPTSFRCEERLL